VPTTPDSNSSTADACVGTVTVMESTRQSGLLTARTGAPMRLRAEIDANGPSRLTIAVR
jgi:hypothetical protein